MIRVGKKTTYNGTIYGMPVYYQNRVVAWIRLEDNVPRFEIVDKSVAKTKLIYGPDGFPSWTSKKLLIDGVEVATITSIINGRSWIDNLYINPDIPRD